MVQLWKRSITIYDLRYLSLSLFFLLTKRPIIRLGIVRNSIQIKRKYQKSTRIEIFPLHAFAKLPRSRLFVISTKTISSRKNDKERREGTLSDRAKFAFSSRKFQSG